jgi:hypothetical protein
LTQALLFLGRFPFARELLRFGDLCRGHFCAEGIPIICRFLISSGSPQV